MPVVTIQGKQVTIPEGATRDTWIDLQGVGGTGRTTLNILAQQAISNRQVGITRPIVGYSELSNYFYQGYRTPETIATQTREQEIEEQTRIASAGTQEQQRQMAISAYRVLPVQQRQQIEQQQSEKFRQDQLSGKLPGTAVFNPSEIGYYGEGRAALTAYPQTVPWYQQTPPPQPPGTQGSTVSRSGQVDVQTENGRQRINVQPGDVVYRTQYGEVASVYKPREQMQTVYPVSQGAYDYVNQRSVAPLTPMQKMENVFGKWVEQPQQFEQPGLVPRGRVQTAEQMQGTYLGTAQTEFQRGSDFVEQSFGGASGLGPLFGTGVKSKGMIGEIPKYAVGGLAAGGGVLIRGIDDTATLGYNIGMESRFGKAFLVPAEQRASIIGEKFLPGYKQAGAVGLIESEKPFLSAIKFGLFALVPMGGFGSKAKAVEGTTISIKAATKQGERTLQELIAGDLGKSKIGLPEGSSVSGKIVVSTLNELPFGQTAFSVTKKGAIETGRVLKFSQQAPIELKLSTGLVTEQIVGAKSRVSEIGGLPIKQVKKNILELTEGIERPLSFETTLGKIEVVTGKLQKDFVPMEEQVVKNVVRETKEVYSTGGMFPLTLEKATSVLNSEGIEAKLIASESVMKNGLVAKVAQVEQPLEKELGVVTSSKVRQTYGLATKSTLTEQEPLTMEKKFVEKVAPVVNVSNKSSQVFSLGTVKASTQEWMRTTSKGVKAKGTGSFVLKSETITPEGVTVSMDITEKTRLGGGIVFTEGAKDYTVVSAGNKSMADWAKGFQQTFQIQKQKPPIQTASFAGSQEAIAQIVSKTIVPTSTKNISYTIQGSASGLAEALPARPVTIISGKAKPIVLKPVTEAEAFGRNEKTFFETIKKEKGVFKEVSMERELVKQPGKAFERDVSKTWTPQTAKEFEMNVEKNMQRNLELNLEKNVSKNMEKSLSKNVEKNLEKNMQRDLSRTFERGMEKTFERTLSRQMERQLQRQLQVPIQKQVFVPMPPIGLPSLTQSPSRGGADLSDFGFVGITKKKGKLFQIPSTASFSYQEAAGKTAGIVKNTLRASFKAVPVAQAKNLPVYSVQPKSQAQALPSEFYKSKQGFYVQKKTKATGSRLGTRGERIDIQLAKKSKGRLVL